MRKYLIAFILMLFMAGPVFGSGQTGDLIQVGDGYLGTAAILDKADTVTDTETLPTGAAILAWGGAGGTGYWTLSGTAIYYNDGRVGIGTDTPGQNLHTYGATGNYIEVQGGAANAVGLMLRNTENLVVIDTDGSGDLKIYTGGATRMTFKNAGNVGIGDSSPATALEVEPFSILSKAS